MSTIARRVFLALIVVLVAMSTMLGTVLAQEPPANADVELPVQIELTVNKKVTGSGDGSWGG